MIKYNFYKYFWVSSLFILLINTAIFSQDNSKTHGGELNNKILLTNRYSPGVYTSFEQFLADAPAISIFRIKVNKGTGSVELYKISGQDSAGILVKNAWGISVGNELYKINKGKLLAIEKVGSCFMLSKFVDPKLRKNNAIFWRNNIGSRKGVKNPFDIEDVLKTTSVKVQKIKLTHLDMNTGELIN
jgi:hypothetical protein